MKVWIRRIIAVVLVLALLLSLQELVVPKYASSLYEGSFTSEYYDETREHQVLMVGDCELYENFDPITLWNSYGVTSYIRGNAQQLAWQSYYLLKEALEKETPEVVVFSVLALKYNEPQKEEYNRLTLDQMKWSKNKVDAIRASMMEDEKFIDYAAPLFRYHARIAQLTGEDLEYFGKRVGHTISGYYMRIDKAPYVPGTWGEENDVGDYTARMKKETEDPAEEPEAEDEGWSAEADEEAEDDEGWSAEADDETEDDEGWSAEADEEAEDDEGWSAEADGEVEDEGWSAEADNESEEEEDWSTEADGESGTEENFEEDTQIEPLGDNAMYYLDQIRLLCESKGVKLLLVKAPSVSPVWYDTWEEQIVTYANQYGLDYINYLNLVDEIGIDFAEDTYDEGLHMNYSGAVKCADYLGSYLKQNYHLEDMHTDEELSAIWEKKARFQQEQIKKQETELKKYGKIVSK